MKKSDLDNQTNYQNATSGAYGVKVFTAGQKSLKVHEFFVISAEVDTTINFESALTEKDTFADQSVTGLKVLAGQTIVTGPIKNIHVTGDTGKITANLFNRPK